MITSPYSFSRVASYLDVGGLQVPVAAVQVNYELNALPSATVVIPLGREGYSGTPSPAHSELLSLVEPQAASLKVEVSRRTGVAKTLGVPEGIFTLFKGYTGSFGYRKSNDPPVAAFQMPLMHWLSDLDYASVFSAWSHPSNPSIYSTGAIVTHHGSMGTAISYGAADVDESISAANIAEEFWTRALRPFFLSLTKQDGLEILEQSLARSNAANAVAGAALRNISSYPGLVLQAGKDANLSQLIQDDLRTRLGDVAALAGSTFWGMLVGNLAGEYLFAISPRIGDAIVVPFAAGAQDTYLTIAADEIAAADLGGAGCIGRSGPSASSRTCRPARESTAGRRRIRTL